MLSSPDARPSSLFGTRLIASVLTGVNAIPHPNPESISGNSASHGGESTRNSVMLASATVPQPIPMKIAARSPMRSTSGPENWLVKKNSPLLPSRYQPAASGSTPATFCKNRLTIRYIVKKPMFINSMNQKPAASSALCSAEKRIIGAVACLSIHTKAAALAIVTSPAPTITGDPQPYPLPSIAMKLNERSARMLVAWPPRSSRIAGSRGDSVVRASAAYSTNSETGTLTKNTARQPKAWINTPPSAGPATAPNPAIVAKVRIALAVSERSLHIATRIASGSAIMIAPPIPWMKRATISTSVVGASPLAIEASVNSTIPMM